MTEYTEHLMINTPRRDAADKFRYVWLVIVPAARDHFSGLRPAVLFVSGVSGIAAAGDHPFRLEPGSADSGLALRHVASAWRRTRLSHQPIGMFGIVKTLVGYFAASVSLRFEVENPVVTFILSFFFYFFHQFLYWVLTRALLGESVAFDAQQTLMFGLLNAAVALPLFRVLDKLKVAQ